MPITIIQPSLPKRRPVSAAATPTTSANLIKSESDEDSSSEDDEGSSDSEAGGVDIEGDIAMRIKKESRRPAKRVKTAQQQQQQQGYGQGAKKSDIVTPGEIITDDPQWMRYV